MLKKIPILTLALLLSIVAQPAAAQTQRQEGRAAHAGDASPDGRALPKNIAAPRSSDTAEGSRVLIVADAALDDYSAYRDGDRFVVLIPAAKAPAVREGLSSRGVAGMRAEARGDGVAISIQLQPGASARAVQKFNRLEVLVNAPSSEVAAVGARAAEAPSTPQIAAGSSEVVPTRVFPPFRQNLTDAVVNVLLARFKANAEADAMNLDLSPPESPAAAVLGLTPQTVIRPSSPRQFATSFLNSLDQNGNFQTGIAFDFVPYMLFNGANVKIGDYQKDYMQRLLARTQFSFVAAKGATEDDLSTRLGVGLSSTLWDRGDPRVYRPDLGPEGDVLTCFVSKLKFSDDFDIPATVDPDDAEAVASFVAGEEARLKPLADKCRDEVRGLNWNRSSWVIAYAPSFISTTGQSADFKWNGGAFWTSVAYGFEEVESLKKFSQLILHARYRTREQIPNPDVADEFLTQNSFFFGGRLRLGGPAFAFNLEDAYVRNKIIGGSTDVSNRFTVGAEARLLENLYFVISAGGNSGRADGQKKSFVLTSFKYGFNRKPQFKGKP